MRPGSPNRAIASMGWLLAGVAAFGQDIDRVDIDGAQLAEARAEFVAAFAAESAGFSTRNDSDRLQAYPLHPYLVAARLERQLTDRSADTTDVDARVAAFLSEFGDEPVGVALRRAWLESLAAREEWPALIEHFDARSASQALECLRLNGHITLGQTDGLAPRIIETWLAPRQLPGVCERPFQWARDEGLLGDDLTEQRARLLLENGQAVFATIIARRLPAAMAAPIAAWADLIQSPAAAIGHRHPGGRQDG